MKDHYQEAFNPLYDHLFNPITGEAWPLQPHILQGMITNGYLPKAHVQEVLRELKQEAKVGEGWTQDGVKMQQRITDLAHRLNIEI